MVLSNWAPSTKWQNNFAVNKDFSTTRNQSTGAWKQVRKCNFLSKQQLFWELTVCHVILEETSWFSSPKSESLTSSIQKSQGSFMTRPTKTAHFCIKYILMFVQVGNCCTILGRKSYGLQWEFLVSPGWYHESYHPIEILNDIGRDLGSCFDLSDSSGEEHLLFNTFALELTAWVVWAAIIFSLGSQA